MGANAADDDEDTAPSLPDTTDKETADCLADADADGNLARVDSARARADPEVSPLARVEAQPPQVPAAPWASNREEAQGKGRTSTDSSHGDVQKKKEQQIHGEPFFTSPAEFAPSVPVSRIHPSPRSRIGQWYCCLNPTRDRI